MILRCKFDKYINNNYHLLRLVDVLSIYKNFLFAYQFPPWEKWKASLLPFSKTKRSEAFRIREDSILLYYRYRWFDWISSVSSFINLDGEKEPPDNIQSNYPCRPLYIYFVQELISTEKLHPKRYNIRRQ